MKMKTCLICKRDFGTNTSTNKCEDCRFYKSLHKSVEEEKEHNHFFRRLSDSDTEDKCIHCLRTKDFLRIK